MRAEQGPLSRQLHSTSESADTRTCYHRDHLVVARDSAAGTRADSLLAINTKSFCPDLISSNSSQRSEEYTQPKEVFSSQSL